MTEYRCVASSIAGFIQQLAVSYVGRGYWFYVSGRIPDGKDPCRVDAKLVERYGIDISKWTRARRKQLGQAGVQYLRHGRFFVLLATHGRHVLFAAEERTIRDIRRTPVTYAGYSVSYRGGHPHVRIARREYLELRAWLLDVAGAQGAAGVRAALRTVAFEPYAPVRRQLLNLLRAANRELKERGRTTVPHSQLKLRRTVGPVFAKAQGASRVECLDVSVQGGSGCTTARPGPCDELGEVGTSLASLAVVDPGLRAAEEFGQCTLGVPGF
jgi:hypothetical protein